MSGTAVCVVVSAAQIGVNFRQFSAQCPYDPVLCALFFQAVKAQWPIRAVILFTSVKFPLPVFKSRANLVEQQFRICVVIGCRLPDAEEIAHAVSALCRWITGNWRPLDGHFERFLGGNLMVVARVSSTSDERQSLRSNRLGVYNYMECSSSA